MERRTQVIPLDAAQVSRLVARAVPETVVQWALGGIEQSSVRLAVQP